MKVEGKVKKILPRPESKNHSLIMDKDNTTVDGESIEKDLFLSAFGSCKGITEGKTYSFDVKVNGDFNNYNPKTFEELIEDGPQPDVSEETVEEEPKKESTKTPESIARVKEHQSKHDPAFLGMCYNQAWENARTFEKTYEEAKQNLSNYYKDALESAIELTKK